MKSYTSVDEYIRSFPEKTQEVLRIIRKTIKDEITGSQEVISYNIPCFKINGKYVVYFAGYKSHVSIYPFFIELEEKVKEVGKYRAGKGTLRFPLSEPLPLPLIRKVVQIMVKRS